MKNLSLTNSSLYVALFVMIVVLLGCSQTNEKKQEEKTPIVQPEKPVCEVEMSASTLKNSLLAPSENLKYTALKLHELTESHNHDRISEQAKNMADESLKLMNASAYLGINYLDSLLYYATRSAVSANALQAHNQSMGKAKMKTVVADLESIAESVSTYTERKVKISEDACLANKEMLENQIRLYFTTIESGIKSIESSLGSHCEDCIAREVAFYENLMKVFREALIKAPTSQYKTVSRTLADIEHTFHELSDLHEEEEAHHTMETLDRQMDRFEDELLDITGRSEI